MRIIIIMRNLWSLRINQVATVTGFSAEIAEAVSSRLAAIGFRVGERVVCIGVTPFGGPRIFQVGDSVFSLGGDLANGIVVDKAESQK